jgi:hypothetical protein
VFTIMRSANLNGALTVRLTWGGTAGYPADYQVLVAGGTLSADRSTLTLASGVPKATITIRPLDDTSVEGTETVTLALVADAAYQLKSPTAATISIADNDKALVAAQAAPAWISPSTLTAARLAPVVALAKSIWIALEPGADFTGVTVEIVDLEGQLLGVTSGTAVFIDATAAGWGWSGTGMDLLSVVLHEFGHALGLDHDNEGLMAETLAAGELFLPGLISSPAPRHTIRPKLAKKLKIAAVARRAHAHR